MICTSWDVRFADTGRGDYDETGVVVHVVDARAAKVTHRRAQTAHQLVNHGKHGALVGNATFDTFRHEFIDVGSRFLEIAIRRTSLHGTQRAHAAIGFVGTSLEQLNLARRFFGTGEQTTQHDCIRTGGNRLGDIAGITDAAIGDHRHTRAFERIGHILDGGDLRHTNTGDDTCRTDGAGTDADLDAIGTHIDERPCRIGRGDVAADDFDLRIVLFDPFNAVENALRVAMSSVDHDYVYASLSQQFDALLGTGTNADSRASTQAAQRILVGERVLGGLENVLDRDQATHVPIIVNNQHALQTVLADQFLGIVYAGAFLDRDEALARRHDGLDRLIEIGFETQVAVGNDTHHLARPINHRQTGNLVLTGNLDDVTYRHGRRNGNRILENARLETLDPGHLGRLGLGGQILVDDADTPLLRHCDRKAAFRHGIHGGGE